MTYYTSIFDRPVAAQNDDIDLMITISKLARTIHELPSSPFRAAITEAICDAISVAGKSLNHHAAQNEVRDFCDYVNDPTLDRDSIRDLITDYIDAANWLVEEKG